MLIYIDTDSGTWGAAENNLVVFDASEADIWHLERYGDSEIIGFGIYRKAEESLG